jgi:hypothetical protein
MSLQVSNKTEDSEISRQIGIELMRVRIVILISAGICWGRGLLVCQDRIHLF